MTTNPEVASIAFETNRGVLTISDNEIKRPLKVFENAAPYNEKVYRFDLREYDISAVLLLADFIKGKHIDIKILSHYAIADLLLLTDIMEIHDLRERVEEILNVTTESSPDQIVTALLSVSAHPKFWRSTLGRTVYDVALRNYQELWKASAFHKIPARILIEILDSTAKVFRCDLLANSENDVFEVARRWLKFNHNRVVFAPNLLECIRYYRLNDQQRAYIIQSIRKLPQGIQLEMIAKTVVGNLNGFRACVLKSHWQNPRCGALPKEIRDRPLNVIPDFIELSQLRKIPLTPTGIKRQLSGVTDSKEHCIVVIRNVHKPRSMRKQRRRARHKRNKEDLKVIEGILGPKTTDVGTTESLLVEKILGSGKLKHLQSATACSSPVGTDTSSESISPKSCRKNRKGKVSHNVVTASASVKNVLAILSEKKPSPIAAPKQ